MEILQSIYASAKGQSWIEWVVLITGLLYVILAARESIWCWFWGIISCSFLAYATYYFYQLQLDALLQIFYVIMGFIGLYRWRYGGQQQAELRIRRMSAGEHLRLITLGIILSLAFGYFFDNYTSAAATYLDASTTMFSVIATFLVIGKRLENWLYWIVVDMVYVYLYSSREAWLFALLLFIYTIIAVFGYLEWRKRYQDIA
ncbi:MAG: nicotinamide riboside transporter PnuC [Bacteroidota bacterium]